MTGNDVVVFDDVIQTVQTHSNEVQTHLNEYWIVLTGCVNDYCNLVKLIASHWHVSTYPYKNAIVAIASLVVSSLLSSCPIDCFSDHMIRRLLSSLNLLSPLEVLLLMESSLLSASSSFDGHTILVQLTLWLTFGSCVEFVDHFHVKLWCAIIVWHAIIIVVWCIINIVWCLVQSMFVKIV